MKAFKRSVSLLLSILLIISVFTIIPLTTASAFSEDTITVFFTDSSGWHNNGIVSVYYWNDGGSNGWPGKAMTYLYTNNMDGGQNVYYAEIPSDVTAVIFNQGWESNGGQTADIKTNIADGAWWYAGGYIDNVYHAAAAPTTEADGASVAYYKLDDHYYNTDLTATTAADVIIPKYPSATVDAVDPLAENVPLFAFDEDGELYDTGKTVAQLGAEYKFTPNETAQEAAASPYADWRCDYVVTFDEDIEAGTFGLYGAYGQYDLAFVYPEDIEAGESVYLLQAAQLGTWTYKDIVGTVQEFTCGAFNLSGDNQNFNKMTVKLVIWDPNEENPTPEALATETYGFSDITEINNPALPTVTVTQNQPSENVPLFAFDDDGELYDTGKTVAQLGAEYTFTPDESAVDAANSFYADWRCDYVVTFNEDIAAGTFGLYGAYGQYDLAFVYPEDIEAGESVYLLQAAQLGTWTYKDIVGTVQKFTCGAFNLSGENQNLNNMTVKLVIWDPNEENPTPEALATETYGFSDITEILPPAQPFAFVTQADPEADVPVFVMTDITDPDSITDIATVTTIENVYTFTFDANESEATAEYYKDWLCDFKVTFNQDIPANTFGLYGSYGDYNIAFVYPEAITAGDSLYLLDLLQLGDWTYEDIKTLVQTFKCGAFNLSEDNQNVGKEMDVALVMWAPDSTAENAIVIDDESYEFDDLTVIEVTIAASAKDANGGEVAATVTGGGDYNVGTEVTLTANDAQGYNFIGWYLDDTQVSTDAAYTFTALVNAEYTAVYEAVGGGKLTVTANEFTVAFDGGAAVDGTGTQNYNKAIGTAVDLTYSGDDFLYWVNASDNIVSREATYSFVLVGTIELTAVSSGQAQQGSATAFVVFHNAYDQIVKQARVDDVEVDDVFPAVNPGKMGCTFDKWVIKDTDEEATASAIISRMSADENVIIEIVPAYIAVEDTYTVKVQVKDGDDTTEVKIIEKAVGVPVVISKAKVAQWSGNYTADQISYFSLDGGETPITFGDEYTAISAVGDAEITVTAVIGADIIPVPVVSITQTSAAQNGGSYKLTFAMKYFVPDDCTVLESGFVYSRQTGDADKLTVDNVGNDGVKKYTSALTDPSAICVLNINTAYADRTFNAAAFLTYQDGDGIHTIYSGVASGSYKSLG